LGKLLEHGVERIGGDAFNDQLAPRNSDRQRLPFADEQRPQTIRDAVDRPVKEWVALGVDGVLVQRDR